MLEFKNVSVTLPGGRRSQPFSMVVGSGDMVCLCDPEEAGGGPMLLAVMGLAPLATGYITVDGELVCPGSADYFRHIMAYVPRSFPDADMTVAELCEALLARKEPLAAPQLEELWRQWEWLGIGRGVYNLRLDRVEAPVQQLVMLSMLPLMNRRIVLIDNLLQTDTVMAFLQAFVAQGSEVVYTCADNVMPCNQIVKL